MRETFIVRGPSASETEARVTSVLADVGCSQASVGPGRYRFARVVWPLPVAVGGTVAAVATLGLALPALLFRRTEDCFVSIEESPTGARVTVVGLVPSAAMTRLRSDLGSRAWSTADSPTPVAPTGVSTSPVALEDRTRPVQRPTQPRTAPTEDHTQVVPRSIAPEAPPTTR